MKRKKPLTVWIVQILLILYVAGTTLAIGLMLLKRLSSAGLSGRVGESFLAAVLFLLIFLVPFLFALHGLLRRRTYGRWLSLVAVFFWWAITLYHHPNPFVYHASEVAQGPIPTFKISPEEEGGAILAQVLVQIFLITLVLRLVFANSVKNYFKANSGSDAPPVESTLSYTPPSSHP